MSSISQLCRYLHRYRRSGRRSVRHFDICVVGHLREEKDSLRAAYAVRDLPASSRIRILHYGKAHNDEWASYAKQEMEINPRYHWFGEVPHWKIRRAYGTCHLMVSVIGDGRWCQCHI
jgi:hypothetical protein